MDINVILKAAAGFLGLLGTAFVLGLATLVILHALKTRVVTSIETLVADPKLPRISRS